MPEMSTVERQVADSIKRRLHDSEARDPRTLQSHANVLGVSDMGSCREKVRHMMVGTERDPVEKQERPEKWSAMWGKAIEDWVLDRLIDPNKGHMRAVELSVTLPSGLTLPGHADLILVDQNLVLDIKTTDGLAWPQRDGASIQQLFQRRLYTAAAIQQGLIQQPAFCGNVWFDRSGSEQDQPHVEIEAFEEWMLDEVDQWYSDVTYAVEHQEQASRDKPFEFCRVACEFFHSCRGRDEVNPAGGVLDDPDGTIDKAAAMYLEASSLDKEAKRLRKAAKQHVGGEVNGLTEHYAVKNTFVGGKVVDAYETSGYWRTTVTPRKQQ